MRSYLKNCCLQKMKLNVVYDVNVIFRLEIFVLLKINSNDCFMQLDIGCVLFLVLINFFKEICFDFEMKLINVVLFIYIGKILCFLGEVFVEVENLGL